MKTRLNTISLILLCLPSLVSAQELAKHFRHEHKSKNFAFHYNDEITTVQSLAKFSDGFIEFIDREFFKARFTYPIHVYVLKDRESFKEFLIKKAGVSDPPNWGIYLSKIGSFVTYEGSGYGTFAHEIMHPLVRVNLRHAPLWADEGIPSFFEKSFGYWEGNRLNLRVGYQNPWRIRALGQALLSLDLESIVKSNKDYGTSEKRMVSVFLYKHGKLHDYIRLVQANKKNGYDTFIEAAFKKRMNRLVPFWKEYLKEVESQRTKILQIPASDIFGTKEEYEAFSKRRGL